MRLINFILFYQYFDNLEFKLNSRLSYLSNKCVEHLSIEDIHEVYDLRIKLQLIRQIERELSDFFIDL